MLIWCPWGRRRVGVRPRRRKKRRKVRRERRRKSEGRSTRVTRRGRIETAKTNTDGIGLGVDRGSDMTDDGIGLGRAIDERIDTGVTGTGIDLGAVNSVVSVIQKMDGPGPARAIDTGGTEAGHGHRWKGMRGGGADLRTESAKE
jgi:hypothetical protein